MINISAWTDEFLQKLTRSFGARIWFVGLQGSYGRDEATETSDIDTVVILNECCPADIQAYDALLETLPYRERLCGFLAGKEELFHWAPSDLFQFYYDTKPLKGSLDALLPLIDEAAVDQAIQIGACNLFHGCVHNMLYEKSEEILRGLYKSASFVLQAICFRETGCYISRQKDLLQILSPRDREIAANFLRLRKGEKVNFQSMSETLFARAKVWMKKTE